MLTFQTLLDEKGVQRAMSPRVFRQFKRRAGHIHDATRPLELVEMDALFPDFHVCDSHQVNLGTPVIYVAIDVATEMVIGIRAYLQRPGQETLMSFCSHAFFPKPQRSTGEHVPYGAPERVLTDQGADFISSAFSSAMINLQCTHLFAEGEAGWKKPIVERFNGEVQERFLHRIAGTTKSSITGDIDVDQVARAGTLTLAQLNEQLEKFAYDVHPNIVSERLSLKFKEAEVTPRATWDRLSKEYPPVLPISRDKFLLSTMTRMGVYTLSHAGLKIQNISYASQELFDLRDEIRTVRGDPKVEVYCSPLDVYEVQAHHLGTGKSARARAKLDYLKGVTRVEWEAVTKELKLGRKKDLDDIPLHELARLIQQSNDWGHENKLTARRKKTKVAASRAMAADLEVHRTNPTEPAQDSSTPQTAPDSLAQHQSRRSPKPSQGALTQEVSSTPTTILRLNKAPKG